MEKKPFGLTSFALKRIAVVSMVIDHIDSFLLPALLRSGMADGTLEVTAETAGRIQAIFLLKSICNALGRLAFPLFCFLMVEGFLHTRDRYRYGLRMGAFALLSEIPFNLAHYQTAFAPQLQNVMFTLAVSIFTLLYIAKAEAEWNGRPSRYGVILLIALVGAGAAFFLRGEYVFLGVAAAVLFYLLREKGALRLLGLLPLIVVSPWVLLVAPFILLYSGERGTGSKWFFYIFYPAHFLAFAALAWLVARG